MADPQTLQLTSDGGEVRAGGVETEASRLLAEVVALVDRQEVEATSSERAYLAGASMALGLKGSRA